MNLGISYTKSETIVGNNDVTGAFRTLYYHSALVAMHFFIIYQILCMYGQLSFCDSTSPNNFEIIALVQCQLTIYFWYLGDTIIDQANPYLQDIHFPLPGPKQYRTNSTMVSLTLIVIDWLLSSAIMLMRHYMPISWNSSVSPLWHLFYCYTTPWASQMASNQAFLPQQIGN